MAQLLGQDRIFQATDFDCWLPSNVINRHIRLIMSSWILDANYSDFFSISSLVQNSMLTSPGPPGHCQFLFCYFSTAGQQGRAGQGRTAELINFAKLTSGPDLTVKDPQSSIVRPDQRDCWTFHFSQWKDSSKLTEWILYYWKLKNYTAYEHWNKLLFST